MVQAVEKVKIVAIGDSITYGYPYQPEDSWTTQAAARLGITIINQGVCGETTGDMVNRFHQDVLPYHPSHVIIMGGTNDVFLGIVVREIIDNILLMVQMSRESGIIPLLGVPIPINYYEDEQALQQYRRWLKQYAATENIALIDFNLKMAAGEGCGLRPELHVDGVHPNESGYKQMAETAINLLQQLVEQS